MEGQELIQVVQLPIIHEKLRQMKAEVDRRVEEAMSMVCTEETIQSVKAVRAQLRKEAFALEEQRKAVRAAVLQPYDEFEEVYDECVRNAYRAADSALKIKIDDVESGIKNECEEGLRQYFYEICRVHHVEWLVYEQAGVMVDMASAKQKTPKKLRQKLLDFVVGVANDCNVIAALGVDCDEIMAEYKVRLNLSDSMLAVSERHNRIQQAQFDGEQRKRLIYEESLAQAEVERIAHEQAGQERKESFAPPKVVQPEEEEDEISDDDLCECTFDVVTTLEKLKKLKRFLIDEGISYESK